MAACLRGLVLAFLVLSFLGAATVQAMPVDLPSAVTATAMPGDCPMVHSAGTPAKGGPCHGLNAACLKQMGCLGISLLPERTDQPPAPVVFGDAFFWQPSTAMAGLSITPEPFPPIAA
ncbi:hypothetical protein UAJ10_02835 [Nitrospirillum sp. BR 11164]|uniref:hypothetical protein n=1 Tax=Nitrospirillum sp. BR 11164 TaxID=3104324 RepID=UPI002AFFC6D4|nr:hypothetical protein [Nitrospirillum sp. BR 11164]MEA1647953.1 hypothetical protein [Nitrospirillum sp. BR 11164]